MIRHCSLWKFTAAAPEGHSETLARAFHGAALVIPSVRACEVGANAGYLSSNLDFAITIDFDDLDGYRDYVAHEAHMTIFRELLEPYLDSRYAVQFSLAS